MRRPGLFCQDGLVPIGSESAFPLRVGNGAITLSSSPANPPAPAERKPMDVIVGPALALIYHLIELYTWVLIIGVIMSWLISFNVINLSNQFVRMIYDVVTRLTEPLLSRIRNFLPDLGGVDISPVILILLLWFAKDVIARLALRLC
jgi:YggT family protein